MYKIKRLIEKIFTKETFLYIIFGILSTIINILLSTILVRKYNVEGNLASTISIFVAIIFAYFANRKLVFNSKAEKFKEKSLEFIKFIVGRLFTMLFEICSVFLLYTVFGIDFVATKIVVTIIVIILNFFISKYFSFKK